MDVKDTWANAGVVAVGGKGVQDLHVALGVLDGQDIGIHADNSLENILEVTVAHVGVDDGGISNASG